MKIFEQMTILMDRMNTYLPPGLVLALCIRILAAGICGAWVGIERTRRFKGAGVRTHVIVACMAALMMIVSKYGFADLTDAAGNSFPGVRGADFVTVEVFMVVEDCEAFDQCLKAQLKEWNAQISSSNVEKKNRQMKYQLVVNMPKNIELDDTVHFLRDNSMLQSFECHFPT